MVAAGGSNKGGSTSRPPHAHGPIFQVRSNIFRFQSSFDSMKSLSL